VRELLHSKESISSSIHLLWLNAVVFIMKVGWMVCRLAGWLAGWLVDLTLLFTSD